MLDAIYLNLTDRLIKDSKESLTEMSSTTMMKAVLSGLKSST